MNRPGRQPRTTPVPVALTVRFDPPDHARLLAEAVAAGVSLAQLVRERVLYAVPKG